MSNRFGRIDLHMHTTVSDGTDTPQELLENARAAGLAVFSATDHDAVKAGQIIRTLRTEDDPLFIPGAEFSCKDAQGKYHILGYGFDPDKAALLELVKRSHAIRMDKILARIDRLDKEFGFSFPEEEIIQLLAQDNPGKPHIGNLMVRYGYAQSIGEAINRYIDRIHYTPEVVSPREVIGGILAAGGIPVLAHPCFGSGSELILGDEMDQRLRRLMDCGLKGLEAFYSGFSEEQRAQMLSLAQKYGLYVTAGSDYHGTNKQVAFGDTGLSEDTEYPDGLRRFLGTFGV